MLFHINKTNCIFLFFLFFYFLCRRYRLASLYRLLCSKCWTCIVFYRKKYDFFISELQKLLRQ